LASIFFQSLQSAPNVAVIKMSYQSSGLLSATLSAARNEDINVALLALQRDGYKITAVPRTEATGKALADITVGVR
jgi:general secretion pathway protein L